MEFYGRKKELAQLMKFISSDEMQMSLIYGRRRIGKSELVKQSIKESGLKSIFYECKQVTEENNVQSMCEVLSDSLGLPKLGYTKVLSFVFLHEEFTIKSITSLTLLRKKALSLYLTNIRT